MRVSQEHVKIGTFSDIIILLWGMLIACYAIDASVGYNYLRGEFINEQWKVFNEVLKMLMKTT